VTISQRFFRPCDKGNSLRSRNYSEGADDNQDAEDENISLCMNERRPFANSFQADKSTVFNMFFITFYHGGSEMAV
jgi:hypothetical protein